MALVAVGYATAEATTVTIPANHQAGDMIIVWAFRDGSTTSPTLPAEYTQAGNMNASGTSCSSAGGYKIAASNAETSGTWTNATGLCCAVYRNQATNKSLVNNQFSNTNSGTAASVNWATQLLKCPGSSWLLAFGGHVNTDTNIQTAPAGLTNQADLVGATAEYVIHDSNGPISSWTSTSVSVGGTAGSWMTMEMEVFAEFGKFNNHMSIKGANAGIISFGERIK